MKKGVARILMLIMLFMSSMKSYSDEIDTIAAINALVTDSLEEIETLYYERTLKHERVSNFIDTSYVFSGLDFSHNSILMLTSEISEDSSILIVVDNVTLDSLSLHIFRYASDIYYGTNYNVYIEGVSNASHVQVKDLILSYQNRLAGVVLIGDIADAKYEQRYKGKYSFWPCDLYYMDLDGLWRDEKDSSNNAMPNGIYEKHEGRVNPDIFVGRISTMGVLGSDSYKMQLMRKYFNKNHDYWLGMRNINNHRALTYVEYPWRESKDQLKGIESLFGADGYDAKKYGDDGFGKNQYVSFIQSDQYDFIQLCAHSGPTSHWFSTNFDSIDVYGDEIHSYQIFNISTNPIGFSLFSCQACNWTFKKFAYRQIDICDAYIYNNGNTLFVVGSTKSGGMLETKNFYTPLGEGACVGNAFKHWFIQASGNSHDSYDIHWFYGMCVIGDPLISMSYDATDFCPDTLLLTAIRDTISDVIVYHAARRIIVLDDFHIPLGTHVIFDAPEIDFAPNFTCINGGTFETRDDGCVCSRGVSNTPNYVSAQKKQNENYEDNHNVAFSVTPNPVNDILSINSSDVLEQIEIYNINGQHAIRTNQLDIDVSSFTQGMYLLRAITTDGKIRQAKFIKQ